MGAKNEKVSKAKKSVPMKNDKSGCAKSFIMEERGEMDKLCEERQPDPQQEYEQPAKEKEAGGEG